MQPHNESESADTRSPIPPVTDVLLVGVPANGWAIALASGPDRPGRPRCLLGQLLGHSSSTTFPGAKRQRASGIFGPSGAACRARIRPLVDWSFAVNYAIKGGSNTWGYHAVNLAVHLAAAFALFGVVRRTPHAGRLAARFAGSAWGLALAVALLWVVHPLQTQGVTYVYQRYEAMVGLFVLLTLYGFIRGQSTQRRSDGTSPRWPVVCWRSPARKWPHRPAVGPLVRSGVGGLILAQIVRRRWKYYAALLGTWPILAALMLGQAIGSPVRPSGGEKRYAAAICAEPSRESSPIICGSVSGPPDNASTTAGR